MKPKDRDRDMYCRMQRIYRLKDVRPHEFQDETQDESKFVYFRPFLPTRFIKPDKDHKEIAAKDFVQHETYYIGEYHDNEVVVSFVDF